MEEALGNAGRLLKGAAPNGEARRRRHFASTVQRIVDAGIPVMGHIGLSRNRYTYGTYKTRARESRGRTHRIVAREALEPAGAFALVIEQVPADLGKRIAATVGVPTSASARQGLRRPDPGDARHARAVHQVPPALRAPLRQARGHDGEGVPQLLRRRSAAERSRLMTRVTEYYHKFIDLSYGTSGERSTRQRQRRSSSSAGLRGGERCGANLQRRQRTHLPANLAGRCMNAAAGDADGDGDLDLALAMEFEPNVLLLNGGTGRFTNGSDRLPRTAHDSEDVAFADFDRDGDLDLVLVSEDDRKDAALHQ